jgi:hypothetical protein
MPVTHELYIERSRENENNTWTEVLFYGDEAECRAEMKDCIEAIRLAGRLVDDTPEIQSLTRSGSTVYQSVFTRLGTPYETHTKFIVCKK